MILRIDDSHPLFPSQKYNNKGQQENIHDWYLTVQGMMFYVEQADLATFNVHFISALLSSLPSSRGERWSYRPLF